MTSARQQLGRAGEEAAAAWYLDRGYDLIDRNWRVREGELDLILGKGQVLVFCEVKTRSSARFGSPFEAVTATKQRRIRRLAVQWLQATGRRAPELRFDVAGVVGDEVTVVEGAF